MTQCWTHQTSLSQSFTALPLFCSCDIVGCRLGCFRSAVTSLHTCTHYLTPAFTLGSHVSRSFIRNESNVRMIYKSHQIHVINEFQDLPLSNARTSATFLTINREIQGASVTPTFWESLRSSTHITRLVLTISVPPYLLSLHAQGIIVSRYLSQQLPLMFQA